MKNIFSYLLTLLLFFGYGYVNGQDQHSEEHVHETEHTHQSIFQNEDYRTLLTHKYLIQDATAYRSSESLGSMERMGASSIDEVFENFKDIIDYLDQANTHHIAGLYSTGLLSFEHQLIDSVSNYLKIDRIPDENISGVFRLQISLFTIKQGAVLAKSTIHYQQIDGIYTSHIERQVSELALQKIENNSLQYRVYPIPAQNQLTIEGGDHPLRVELIDIHGHIVFEQQYGGKLLQPILIEPLPPGHYFLRLRNLETTATEIHKIVKL